KDGLAAIGGRFDAFDNTGFAGQSARPRGSRISDKERSPLRRNRRESSLIETGSLEKRKPIWRSGGRKGSFMLGGQAPEGNQMALCIEPDGGHAGDVGRWIAGSD